MLLWLGQSVSKLGTSLYNIALMWYLYKKTGSSIALGLSVAMVSIGISTLYQTLISNSQKGFISVFY